MSDTTSTILVKKDNFLILNTDGTKQEINVIGDQCFLLNDKYIVLKDKKLYIYQNNKRFLFSDGVDNIIKEKDYIILVRNNIVSVFDKSFKEINKHIIPQKSLVLYCDDKNLIYSANHKLFLVANDIIELPFYSNV